MKLEETTTGRSLAGVEPAEVVTVVATVPLRPKDTAGWVEDARAYNELITSWSAIESAASEHLGPQQGTLFGT